MGKKDRTRKLLSQTHPSEGIRIKYERALLKLINEMNKSTIYWLSATFKKSPMIAQDSAGKFVSEAHKAFERLIKQWQRNYDEVADQLAKHMVFESTKHADITLKNAFKKAGFTVDFHPTDEVKALIKSDIHFNVGLIKSIPQKYFDDISFIVNEGINRGFDASHVKDQIQKKYGVSARRASFIARDQTQKVHTTVTAARQEKLGITEGQWIHSGGAKEPRPSHVKAGRDKLIFDLKKGAFIDGKWILPGQEPNCGCTWRAVLPSFD